MQDINKKKYDIIINRHQTKLKLNLNEVKKLIKKHCLKLVITYDFPSGFRFSEISFDRLIELINNDKYNETEINLNKYTDIGLFDNSVVKKINN